MSKLVMGERERCAMIAETEPEAPGPMPDEFNLIPLEDAIRGAIRATKKSIAARIRETPSNRTIR